jgi:hypothetical protein
VKGANPHDEIKGSNPFPAFSRALENIVKFREIKIPLKPGLETQTSTTDNHEYFFYLKSPNESGVTPGR